MVLYHCVEKIRNKIFGDEFAIGVYHPDTTVTSKTEIEMTGTVGDKEVKRKAVIMNKQLFEKALVDLKATLRSVTGNPKAEYQVVIKGDKNSNYGVVEDLMDSLHETQNKVFSLVTIIKADKKEE